MKKENRKRTTAATIMKWPLVAGLAAAFVFSTYQSGVKYDETYNAVLSYGVAFALAVAIVGLSMLKRQNIKTRAAVVFLVIGSMWLTINAVHIREERATAKRFSDDPRLIEIKKEIETEQNRSTQFLYSYDDRANDRQQTGAEIMRGHLGESETRLKTLKAKKDSLETLIAKNGSYSKQATCGLITCILGRPVSKTLLDRIFFFGNVLLSLFPDLLLPIFAFMVNACFCADNRIDNYRTEKGNNSQVIKIEAQRIGLLPRMAARLIGGEKAQKWKLLPASVGSSGMLPAVPADSSEMTSGASENVIRAALNAIGQTDRPEWRVVAREVAVEIRGSGGVVSGTTVRDAIQGAVGDKIHVPSDRMFRTYLKEAKIETPRQLGAKINK